MPMTDAPNSGTKFDRRKPCLRYIGPLLGTTCGASVGRGDYTPPSCSAPPVGGGLRPAPLARSVFLPISVGSEYLPISRRGGPMCPTGHAFLRDPPTGRHAGRPLQILHLPPSKPGGDGAPPLPVPPKPSINPGKTECLSENPQTNSPFSILHSQFSIIHCPFPRKFTITNYHLPGGPYV